jgi:xylan 1,4-beta-xylosidase
MMSKLSGQRVAVTSSAEQSLDTILESGVRGPQGDVAALAILDARQLAVLVWHYHDDDVPGPDAAVLMELAGLPAGDRKLAHYRIDRDHSNAFTVWQRMGSPAGPNLEQYQNLVAAGQLARLEEASATVANGGATVRFVLPRQAVSLLVFA